MSAEDEFEAAVRAGAVSALRRKRAQLLERARSGTTEQERFPGVMVATSQAAHAANRARQLGEIADDIEAGL